MLNVHAGGGGAMMRAAAEAATKAAKDFGVARPICLGVTVLTSLDRTGLQEVGVTQRRGAGAAAGRACAGGWGSTAAWPRRRRSGCCGRALGPRWTIVAPGIRPAERSDDQKRVATPTAAIRAGADAIVVGRPITAVPDPKAAAAAILSEIANVWAPKRLPTAPQRS